MKRDLFLVAFAMATWGLGEGIFRYFEPLYLQELGADMIAIGGILGFIGFAMASAHIPAGYISDRMGRRPMIFLAWIIGTIAAFLMAFAPNLISFVIGAALYHMTAFVSAPLYSYVTAARGKLSVSRTITLISASFSFGEILGPLLGGWIGENYGLQRNFIVATGFFIISTAMILMIRSQPVEKDVDLSRFSGFNALRTKSFKQFSVIIFLAMFCMYLPQPLSQNFLQNERGLDLVQIGILLSVSSVGIVFIELVLGQINARKGFLISHIAIAIFSLLLWRGNNFLLFMIAYFLMGSYRTARSLSTAQSRFLVKANNMGLAYGVLETIMAISAILAPPLSGLLYSYNPSLIYTSSLPLIGFSILVAWRFLPKKDFKILEG